jgi:hypothetical protein
MSLENYSNKSAWPRRCFIAGLLIGITIGIVYHAFVVVTLQ